MNKFRTMSGYTKTACLVLPAFILTAGITVYTIVSTCIESMGYLPGLNLYGFSLDNFRILFSDRTFPESLAYSFTIAACSTIMCLVFGLVLGYLVCKVNNPLIQTLYRMPFILSYIAAGILIYTTLSDHGVLWHILSLIGIAPKGFNIVYNSSGIAVITLNCFKGVPFMAMSTAPAFFRATKHFPATAMNLGASGFLTARKIILPLVKHSALTTALVLFNYQLFSYEGFYYLGSSTPVSLGVLSYESNLFSDLRSRTLCMTISTVMIGISLISSAAYIYVMRKDWINLK